ncbi:toll/interleukin-1 receptor domain-containing protein [Amycolatopsis sp. cg9]|uniref:toll/interleukin-1 receptor domain-containing protein n=1 Tax=Amycolatopsis sp. cg9 TaxID=3238801 RepID=UPI003524FF08
MSELNEEWTSGFWSYVRDDDVSTKGKLSEIREDLIGMYALETGDQLKIFQDTESIGWGESWENALGYGISRTVFFIPLVTPNYFKSEACRKELLAFYQLCQARGIDGLILPIIISGKDKIRIDHEDEVVRIIAKSNYESFEDIWPSGRGGEAWISGVRRLARKLIEAERRVEEQLPAILENELQASGYDASGSRVAQLEGAEESPGLIEIAEEFEPLMPLVEESVQRAVTDFTTLAGLLAQFGDQAKRAGNNPNLYKSTIINMAKSIEGPTAEFVESASEAQRFVLQADQIFKRYRSIVNSEQDERIMAQFRAQLDSGTRDLREVATIADQLDDVSQLIASVENISTVLRRSLRPANRGIRMLSDAARTVASWAPEDPQSR